MLQEVKLTREEKVAFYNDMPKAKLIEVLIDYEDMVKLVPRTDKPQIIFLNGVEYVVGINGNINPTNDIFNQSDAD